MSTHTYVGKGGWTGKRDITGTGIEDGDILTYPTHPDPYVIAWNDDEAGFECECPDNYMIACVWCKMEIIGNMRDNPELVGYTK